MEQNRFFMGHRAKPGWQDGFLMEQDAILTDLDGKLMEQDAMLTDLDVKLMNLED